MKVVRASSPLLIRKDVNFHDLDNAGKDARTTFLRMASMQESFSKPRVIGFACSRVADPLGTLVVNT